MGGGGGGPSGPTQQNVTQTNIPEYARPYVESMLGATQQQLFNTQQGPGGETQITGVKGYTPFGATFGGLGPTPGNAPSDRYQEGMMASGAGNYPAGMGPTEQAAAQAAVAGFSPLQRQAQQGIANLQMPGQFGIASDAALAATQGALGAGNYQPGMFSGGRFGGREAAMYMNPYLEQSLAPQIAEAQRQAGIAATQQAGQAVKSGAFGGSRYGLQEAELQRNLGQNISNIVGQGYNQAFQQAQQQFNQDMARRMQAQQMGEQSRQFGAGLGLQGMQTGLQGASQLANIGAQELGARQGILGLQAQTGQQQQQQQQNVINQMIQNYATTQQYPQQQLAFMNAMLRGLPLQTTTTQGYQAPPSAISQLAGLGTAGLAGYKLANMKEGGEVEQDTGIVGLGLSKALS